MRQFQPNLSLKDNWLSGADLQFAAWEFADHDHREEYRDSGQNPQRSAWLERERQIQLGEALASGEFVALAISEEGGQLQVRQIPEIAFATNDLNIDWENSRITALGQNFCDVRVCRANSVGKLAIRNSLKLGRPNHLAIIHEAWIALKTEIPGFLEMAKSTQNREIQERLKVDYPSKFPGNAMIGESTIRRHRRENPGLFD